MNTASRLGSMPKNLHVVKLKKVKLAAFFDELAKLSAVDPEEALDAAKELDRGRQGRARRYAASGAIGGVTAPAINVVGEAAKGFADAAKGQRLRGALTGVKAITRGSHVSRLVTGASGGAAINAMREGVQQGAAKRKVEAFLSEHGEKLSTHLASGAVGAASSIAGRVVKAQVPMRRLGINAVKPVV